MYDVIFPDYSFLYHRSIGHLFDTFWSDFAVANLAFTSSFVLAFFCTLFWLSYVLLIYIITCQSVITFHINEFILYFSNSVYFLPSSVCALMCLDLLQFGCRRPVAHSA